MAGEAVLVREDSPAMNYDCSEAVGIEKGAILKNTTAMTAVLSDGQNDIVAGIAQSEKIAGDGIDSVSLFRDGLFRVLVSGSVSAGDPVVTADLTGNDVVLAVADDENILGIMVEAATDGQSKLMELRPTTMQLA